MSTQAKPCICPSEGWCPRYSALMVGGAYHICKSTTNCDVETREKYLRAKLAQKNKIKLLTNANKCQYLGGEYRDSDGNAVLRECVPCGGKTRLKVFQCSHPSHDLTTIAECQSCPDNSPLPIEDYDDRLDAADLDGATWIPRQPSLCHADGRMVGLNNHFYGKSAFFIGGGPSLLSHDLSLLNHPNIITYSANNTIKLFNPTIWSCVDPPTITQFPAEIWESFYTMKIVPRAFAGYEYAPGKSILNCPAIFYFRRNCRFRAEQFFSEPTFNWGCDADVPDGLGNYGGRSVMLPVIKIIYYLGIRTIYLIGCDFHMTESQPYAHDQHKDETGCNSNNKKFQVLDMRFRELLPQFTEAGLQIFNCTPGGNLTAFPRITYEEAIKQCSQL